MKLSALLLPALLVVGCTTVVTGSGPGDTGGSSTGGNSSSTPTSPPVGGACTTAGGCGSDGFCHFPYAACRDETWQAGEYDGTCQARPVGCSDIYQPVCGCDGQVYPNTCTANSVGQDLGAKACAPSVTPSGFIPCGPLYCDPSGSYCAITYGDEGDTFWGCTPLPPACVGAATPDCGCLTLTAEEYKCTVVQGQGVSGLEVDTSPI